MENSIHYLEDMYADDYFPDNLVDKVKKILEDLVAFLEVGNHSEDETQAKFDDATEAINELETEFEENGSEIETVARESIGETVDEILTKYQVGIDFEEALRKRDW